MARDLRTRTFGVATHRAASGDVAAPAAADGLHTLPPDETSSAVTPDIDHHNRVTALAAQRAWDVLEPRLADLIAPVLRRAGRTAAARFRHHATRSMTAAAYRTSDRLRLAALSPGERQQLMLSLAMTAAGPPDLAATATMVCVMPTPEQQAALAVGDQDAAILHVTLVYLGEYDGPLNRLAAVMAPVAATFAPLHGTVAGRGTFGDNVQLLLPDVPGLVELRVAVTQALVAAGLDYARDHGYLSHITVSYTPVADDGGVVGTPLDFADLLIVRGNTEVIRLPFVGMPPITAAGDASRSTQPAVSAQAIASQLAETQLLEEAALKAEQRAQSTASQEELRSAIERVDEARRIAGDAQHSGDPERIFNASRALQVAQDNLMRTLQSASPPAGAPGPGGPGEQPGAPPVQPGPAQPAGKLQPLPTHAQLPGPSEVVHEIQKSKTQELFGPPGERPTPTSVGLSLDQLLEQEALMQGPGEAAASHEPPDWTRPSGHELLNTDELMQQVRGVTDPVRQAVIRSVGTPIVENAGIGWNDANPFAARVLAQSASQVTHITETTQAKLMQIVNTSYEQGLTIPDTAKLIQQHMAEATPARARLIARTELAGAVNGGSLAATQIVQQATGTQYRKTWLTAPGAPHPRHENYDGLDGQQADLDGYFTVGDARLQYPGDPAGPPEEVCNCVLGETVVETPGLRAATRRWYDGDVVRLRLATGDVLAATPNHPVLRDDGRWVPVSEIHEGDDLVCARPAWHDVAAPDPDAPPATISELYAFAQVVADPERVCTSPADFHGDVFADGDVDVVTVDGTLLVDGQAATDEQVDQFGFTLAYAARAGTRDGGTAVGDVWGPDVRAAFVSTRDVRRGGELGAFVTVHAPHPDQVGLGARTDVYAEAAQALSDRSASDADSLADGEDRFAALVSLTQVVKVDRYPFAGHVYNLDTGWGWFTASSLATRNCRCSLTYAEAATDDNGGTVADTTAVGGPARPDALVVPAGTLQTSDPAAAAQALADGQNVVLNQPDEISTFLEDLGQQAAQAQAAGKAALNLDLGKVSVKGTNLFTQDSLGIPRIDMPQLSGKPLPGSLASKLPGGYEGQADQVDIGPLFYQHLRDQGVTITEEDVLASHLRSTQRDINGAKVAGLMDRLAAGTASERRIPISADGYIVDGHHEWAATIGLDYKTGTDAGLTLPVYRINQPITKILGEANAFDAHYGIPRVSAFVPKVTDTGMADSLAHPTSLVGPPAASDTVVGITPFRPEDTAAGFYDSAKAKQFEADLSPVADQFGVTITSSDRVTGVWQGSTEPAYSVRAHDGKEGVAKFAETLRARYNQDGVLIFRPAAAGRDFEFTIHDTNPTQALPRLADYGVDGATVSGSDLVLIGDEKMGDAAARIAHDFGGAVTYRQGDLSFVERHVAPDVVAGTTASDPYIASLQKELAATSRSIQRLEQRRTNLSLTAQEEQQLRGLNDYRDNLRGYIATPNPAAELTNLRKLIDTNQGHAERDAALDTQLRMLEKRRLVVQGLLDGRNVGTARVAAKAQGKTRTTKPVAKSTASLLDPADTPAGWAAALRDVPDRQPVPMAAGAYHADGFTYHVGPSIAWKENGVVFRKELPAVDNATIADTTKVAAETQAVTSHFFDGIPPEIAAHVHNINIFDGRNPEDVVWEKQYNMPGFLSGASSADGTTTFWNASRTDVPQRAVSKEIFEHEIGHLAGYDGGPINSYGWVTAANADAAANTKRFKLVDAEGNALQQSGVQTDPHGFVVGSRGVSDYGSNSIEEDWAETMRLYLLNKRVGNIGSFRGKLVTLEGLFPARAAEFERQLHLPALGARPRVGSRPG